MELVPDMDQPFIMKLPMKMPPWICNEKASIYKPNPHGRKTAFP